MLDEYPLDLEPNLAAEIKVEKVLQFRTYITKLAIYIKLIDFTNPEKIREFYETFKET